MNRFAVAFTGLATALTLAAAPASAATITGLYNTGVNSSGTVLANGASEQHYQIIAGTTALPRVATSANGYPIGPWLGDNTTSAWIAPNTDASMDAPAGSFTYRLTFDLAGLNASTAAITGRWSTDDAGLGILLNGVATGATAGGFQGWYNFAINAGFVSGINTLDFVVLNGGGPTGLRVELAGTANAANGAVPEPATWAMMIAGFGAVGFAMRRRRSANTVVRFA